MIIKNKKAPGEKLIKKLSLEQKHFIAASSGLIIFSFGLCLFSEAGNLKHNLAETQTWVAFGTLSLIFVGAGLSIFGRAITYRTEIKVKEKLKERQKRFKENKPQKKKSSKINVEKNPQD